MKLALLTTIACNMAVAYAAEDRVGVRGFLDQLFGANQLQYVATEKAGQPDYCYEDTEDADCFLYKNGYPKCCTKEKGNCPVNNKPVDDGCTGSCNPGNDRNDQCYDGSSNERDDDSNNRNPNRDDCFRDNDCTYSDEYCSKIVGECGNNYEGFCVQRGSGDGSDGGNDPVCGCDGRSYEDSDDADNEGVSVDYEGCCDNDNNRDFCDSSNNRSGNGPSCDTDRDCASDEFCGQATFGRCDRNSGFCLNWPRESDCDNDNYWVCGCDGKDYRNECYASAASVSVDYDGRCD